MKKINLLYPFLISALAMASVFSCQDGGPVSKEKTIPKESNSLAQSVVMTTPKTPAVDPSITIDYLMGKFDPVTHPNFIEIELKYASRAGMRLRKQTYQAFLDMQKAAASEGVVLKILSATRPFDHQKRIWEAKWNGSRKVDGKALPESHPKPKQRALKILEYSSMPGTSRHHWGTDIDINALNNEYFDTGKGYKEYQWLIKNAPAFGFCQPYSPKGPERPDGYNEERWHWSYLPISKPLTEQYELRIKSRDISGFEGAEAAALIDVVPKYVIGISKDCL
jgi:LAS superfamily LD-carboxypeptidase LdcB